MEFSKSAFKQTLIAALPCARDNTKTPEQKADAD